MALDQASFFQFTKYSLLRSRDSVCESSLDFMLVSLRRFFAAMFAEAPHVKTYFDNSVGNSESKSAELLKKMLEMIRRTAEEEGVSQTDYLERGTFVGYCTLDIYLTFLYL